MGVLGLTPFLQKHWPEVVKILPERLRSLKGKRIVIDGTLITQRLHFAPAPHPYRHIIGWYRLIAELKESGVGVICVFDGKERNLAKASEIQRRRETRRIQAARGLLETGRLQRLQRLYRLLKAYQALPVHDRAEADHTLKVLMEQANTNTLAGEYDELTRFDWPHGTKLPYIAAEIDEQSVGAATHADIVDGLASAKRQSFSATEEHRSKDTLSFHNCTQTTIKPVSCLEDVDNTLPAKPRKLMGLTGGEGPISPYITSMTLKDGETYALVNEVSHPSNVESKELKEQPRAFRQPASGLLDGIHDIPYFKETPRSGTINTEPTVVAKFAEPRLATRISKLDERFRTGIGSPFCAPNPIETEQKRDLNSEILSSIGATREDSTALHNAPTTDDLQTQLRPPEYLSGDLHLDWDPYDRDATYEWPQSCKANSHSVFASRVVLAALAELYGQYRSMIPTSTPGDVIGSTAVHDDEPHADVAESRLQNHLTLEEGKIWDEIAESISHPERNTTEALSNLAHRSQYMSEAFERRSKPPTSETYTECKMILAAMGVPCIESTAPFEAEALASSLVINGHADFVASEDTDVLVFEAPLVRNITNRKTPLITISGADVRAVLQLDRSSYVDFALLLGTDFSQRIKNVGPMRALKFIKKHGSIERIIQEERKNLPSVPTALYFKQVELARLVFHTLPSIPDANLLCQKETDDIAVTRILQSYGLSQLVDDKGWDFAEPLAGNYFGDDPSLR